MSPSPRLTKPPRPTWGIGLGAVKRPAEASNTNSTDGKLTVRVHHIGIGRRHAHKTIAMLVAGRDIRIIDTHTGEFVRQLTLNPARDYQPQT
ncbi:MAG TPA: hypothetical protein VI462_13355 [Acidimicrobiia bacterium]